LENGRICLREVRTRQTVSIATTDLYKQSGREKLNKKIDSLKLLFS